MSDLQWDSSHPSGPWFWNASGAFSQNTADLYQATAAVAIQRTGPHQVPSAINTQQNAPVTLLRVKKMTRHWDNSDTQFRNKVSSEGRTYLHLTCYISVCVHTEYQGCQGLAALQFYWTIHIMTQLFHSNDRHDRNLQKIYLYCIVVVESSIISQTFEIRWCLIYSCNQAEMMKPKAQTPFRPATEIVSLNARWQCTTGLMCPDILHLRMHFLNTICSYPDLFVNGYCVLHYI